MKSNLKSKLVVAFATMLSTVGLGVITANADTVTVQPNDTVWGLSQKYQVPIDTIQKSNGIDTVTSLIFVGQTLNIPTVQVTPAKQVQAQIPVTQVAKQVTPPVKQVQKKPEVSDPAQVQQQATPKVNPQAPVASVQPQGGSTYQQFLNAGGTPQMWSAIVMPESRGQANAQNGRYYGLFQGDRAYGWSTGSVATQTQGAINYATSRYGSVANAVSFHQSHGWW